MRYTIAVVSSAVAILLACRAGTVLDPWDDIGDRALSRSMKMQQLRSIACEKVSIGDRSAAICKKLGLVPFPHMTDTLHADGRRTQFYYAGTSSDPALIVKYLRDGRYGPYIVQGWEVQ